MLSYNYSDCQKYVPFESACFIRWGVFGENLIFVLTPWDGTNILHMTEAAPEYLVPTTLIFCACTELIAEFRGRLQPSYPFDKVLFEDPPTDAYGVMQ